MSVNRTSTLWQRVLGRFVQALDTSHLDSIEMWRERFIAVVMLVLIVVLPAATLIAAPVLLRDGLWYLLVLDCVVWLSVIVGALRPQKAVRGMAIMTVLYALLISFLVAMGPGEARPAWLVTASVIGALLFGARAAIACLTANLGLLLFCYFGIGRSLAAWQSVYSMPSERWWLLVSSTTVLSLVASLPIGFLLDGLTVVLSKERDLRKLLVHEHEDLERAHRALLDEVVQRERLEHDLRQAQKLEALGSLAGGVAHDLNNFLVPILLGTEMVRDRMPPASEDRAYLDQVIAASMRAKELVARVLAFSRKVPPPDAYVPLYELVTELAAQLRAHLPTRVTLQLELCQECDPVLANRVALAQVVTNLVSNAIAAMPEGGILGLRLARAEAPSPTLAQEISGIAVLSVSDTGTGMDEKTAAHVFEPFFTTKQMGEGTGLGLATVHGIVTSLGGRIGFETSPGCGTTFTVELPTRRPPRAADSGGPSPTLRRPTGRVLLVDDDGPARLALRRTLEALGLEVENTSNAPVAIELVERASAPFDLLITDNRMPQTTGLDMVSTLRQKGHRVPVMLITGFPDNAVMRRASELDVAVVLPKPFGHSDLLRALSALLPSR